MLATARTDTPNLLLHGDIINLTPTPLTAASGAPDTTPQGGSFGVAPNPGSTDTTLELSAVGIGAVPTTVTANLLVSFDNGATWQDFATNLTLVATSKAAAQTVQHLVAGPLYAIALSAVTLGSATGVSIRAAIN